MGDWPEFVLCVLPPEMLTDEQKWYLKGGDYYSLGHLTLEEQFELAAEVESFVRDWKEDLEEARTTEDGGE